MESDWQRRKTLPGASLLLDFGRKCAYAFYETKLLTDSFLILRIGEICTVILAGSIPMLPGFVKFVRGRDEARSGSSLPRSRSRWPHLSNAASKHKPIHNDNSPWGDSFARMGATTDAHVSASALIDPETEVVPLSIMKTVHVVTKSSCG